MQHLVRVNGYYYLRLRVPVDMQGVLMLKEIKKSLRTRHLSLARVLAKSYDYEINRIFMLARCGVLRDGDIRTLVDEFMRKTLKQFEDERAEGINLPKLEDLEDSEGGFVSPHYEGCEVVIEQCKKALVLNDLKYIEPSVDEMLQEKEITFNKGSIEYKRLCRRLLRGLIDVYEIEKKRILGDYSKGMSKVSPLRNKPELQSKQSVTAKQHELKTGKLLSDVMSEYVKLKGENWKHKTKHEMEHIFRLALDVIGDRDVKALTLEDFLRYREVLKVLPPNHYKKKEYKDKSIAEIVEMVRVNPVEAIAVKTLNKNIQTISGLLKWCVKKQYLTLNHAEGLAVKKKGKSKKARKPFDIDDLKALRASPVYSENAFKDRPERFWMPLMGLFTGARANELASLYVEDVVSVDGIMCFNITEEGEDKSIKNPNSRRLVPIHPVLIKIGLLEYVDKLKNAGEKRLFPKLKYSEDNGYAGALGKWFGRYNRQYITKDDSKVYHSFRHTVADTLKQQGVDYKQIEEILGHEDQSMSTGYYANPYQVKILHEALKKLTYANIFDDVKFSSLS